MDILRRTGESKFDYVKRLTDNRKEYDLSYDEWVKLICNYECSSENGRKAHYVLKRLLDELEEEFIENASQEYDMEYIEGKIMELEMKKLDLKKERVKINTLRNELNKSVLSASRKELFYENIHNEIVNNPLEPIKFSKLNTKKTNQEYLLMFADVHYGSTFNVGTNKYSPEICEERFNQLFNDVVELIKEEEISHLHIASLGDLIQGVLRITDISLNSLTMIEQIMGVVRIIANFLNHLSEYTTITYYHCINANHSELRLLGTKSGELQEDVELLMGNYIKDLLVSNKRVEVVIGNDSVLDLELCGYNLGLLHGQNVKNKETFVKDLSFTRHKNYDYVVMGHIHHYSCMTVATTQDGNPTQIISVPSLVGACPYSKKIMKMSPSGALMLKFKENKGKTNTYELNLK